MASDSFNAELLMPCFHRFRRHLWCQKADGSVPIKDRQKRSLMFFLVFFHVSEPPDHFVKKKIWHKNLFSGT